MRHFLDASSYAGLIMFSSSSTLLALTWTAEMNTGVSILVTALCGVLVSLYIARTARLVALREVAKVIAPVEAKVDALAPVVAKIEGHVNSEKTKAAGEHDKQKLQIEMQREMIEELKKAAALLAQARSASEMAAIVVAAVGAPAVGAPAVGAPAVGALKNIETNTAAIEKNTAKTEATVQRLEDTP